MYIGCGTLVLLYLCWVIGCAWAEQDETQRQIRLEEIERDREARRQDTYARAAPEREVRRQAEIVAQEAIYARALADAEAGLTSELSTVRMLAADTLRTLHSMTPSEYAGRH